MEQRQRRQAQEPLVARPQRQRHSAEAECSRSAVCAKVQRLGLKRGQTSKPVVVRRPFVEAAPRPPTTHKPLERVNYTKRELQDMLAKKVKNTGL